MQQISYKKDIEDIIKWIDIDTQGIIHFKGDSLPGLDYPDVNLETRMLIQLSGLLYGSCYTRGSDENQTDPTEVIPDEFLDLLKKSNVSFEDFDYGWNVEEIEPGGNIMVSKGGYRRYTYAGDFLREHIGQGPLQKRETIHIKHLPELKENEEDQGNFYYVFGNTLLESNQAMIIRFYFHVKPVYAPDLIQFISTNCNRFHVPFQFKCLNHPSLYTRCDAAVLYLEKRYVDFFTEILKDQYDRVKFWLKNTIPMFTYMVAPGIGFAENPFTSEESFGTNRCKIIAQGILRAWKEHVPKTAWLDSILSNIQKSFLDPEALYLNPSSKYPYHFSKIKD